MHEKVYNEEDGMVSGFRGCAYVIRRRTAFISEEFGLARRWYIRHAVRPCIVHGLNGKADIMNTN